jgi:hypothetical protein
MKDQNILRSWKEIASYLGYESRSCRRWEIKLGLPVHRIGGAKKSSVFAYKEELDTWLRGHVRQIAPQPDHVVKARTLRKGLRRSPAFATFIVAAFFFVLILARTKISAKPEGFDIKEGKLIILSENGKKLWEFDTKTGDLVNKDIYYRGHFQRKDRNSPTASFPYLIIKDINNDSYREVLFTIKTTNDLGEGILFCFNQNGTQLWKFDTGIARKYGDKVYSPDYKIRGFDLHDFDGDGRMEIVIIASQFSYFPCRLVVLDSEGTFLGEFWNSGHISDFMFADINEDGRDEIIAGGMNNEYEKACIIVLDSSALCGGSPQIKDYFACRELQPGTEVCYALLPRTFVDKKFPYPGESINFIEKLKGGRIRTQAYLSGIYYEFDLNLHPQDARKSPLFSQRWEEARKIEQAIDEVGPEFWSDLLAQIQYWDGGRWVDQPVINSVWQATKTDRK